MAQGRERANGGGGSRREKDVLNEKAWIGTPQSF